MENELPLAVDELIERSRRLGSDPRNTNYAGGNASCKAVVPDPVSGDATEVMWVKGSGGDLGTLTRSGLVALRVNSLRSLRNVYRGLDYEDEMVSAFDYCHFGKNTAAPSIDTAMHGLVECTHVDHLHPDAGIAIATSVDGKEITNKIYGDLVKWIPWRRPGFQLGVEIAEVQKNNPDSIGVILGGHGITTWGKTSDECESNSLKMIRMAREYILSAGRPQPFGSKLNRLKRLDTEARLRRASELFPFIRGLASTDSRQVGHFDDSEVVLSFLDSERCIELAARGSSCPDHFIRTKIRPMVLDCDSNATLDETVSRLAELHQSYRKEYADYYMRYATADSPAMRGADPAIVLVPGVGMFSFGSDAQTARVAGEFFINSINIMEGAEAISRYEPIDEFEKFRIEYWQLEEEKLRRRPPARPLAGKVAFVTGAGSGIGAATARRLSSEGAHVVVADIDESSADSVASEIGGPDFAVSVPIDVTSAQKVKEAILTSVRAFGGIDILVNNAGLSVSKSLFDTTEDDWDIQHNVMARGSFLVSKAIAKVMKDQGLGGDIVYIVSKNSVFAGPNNVAYGAAKADQAHQVRLLAAELGEIGIRVNGINPDGVVRGSKIFSSGWGAQRAAVYGVNEEDLGNFYAGRTILKVEVTPENVASAVFVLVGGDLSLTTGAHIPVDSGVASGFLR